MVYAAACKAVYPSSILGVASSARTPGRFGLPFPAVTNSGSSTATILFDRFRLLFSSIPVVAVVLVVRFLVQEVWDIGEVATFGEIGSVITGVTLILGFMLGGVLADYKESERLPAVVAVGLGGFQSACVLALTAKDQDHVWATSRVAAVGEAVHGWLLGQRTDAEMWAAHADLSRLVTDVEKAGGGTHYLGRMMTVNGELTATLNRIAVIRNTSFVQSGYVLMTFLVFILQLSLAVVTFPSTVMSWIAPSVLSLAYAYLLLLVRDLDNPFGHGDNDGHGSGADVDISPVATAAAALRRAV
ncbi:MAG: hypothetical protein RJA47_610 [Actinomycetota bacterium]